MIRPAPDPWIDKRLVARVNIRGHRYTFYSDGARKAAVKAWNDARGKEGR